jgi:hypothetical protein
MTINDNTAASGIKGLEELLYNITEKTRAGGGWRRKRVLKDKELKLVHVEASHTYRCSGGRWYLRRETLLIHCVLRSQRPNRFLWGMWIWVFP